MKKFYFLILIFSVFLIGCGPKGSVTNAITEIPSTTTSGIAETPTSTAITGVLSATYNESNTYKSISVGDTLDNYIGNFKLTSTNGTSSSSITVTKDMISLDTSTVGEKIATISYNGASTTVSAIVCTHTSDFAVSSDIITKYNGTGSTIVIPRYIDGTEITTLGNAAFKENTDLTSVVANNIATISDGEGAYSGTFYECRKLTSIFLPKVTSIGDWAFANCTALTSISFPKMTSIGEWTFISCTSLISIFCPEVISIGQVAFANCTALTSISFPKVTSIERLSFSSCGSLISVSFPEVISIGVQSFDDCGALTSIFLPKVTSIGSGAFSYCTRLTSVTFENAIPPTLEMYVFPYGGVSKVWNIRVPSGASLAYSRAFLSETSTFYNTSIPTITEY